LKAYIDATDKVLDATKTAPELSERLTAYRKKLKIDFLLEDIPGLLAESLDGTERVKEIVQDLRNFSRIDAAETAEVDLNQCLESTLSLLRNGLEKPIDLIPELGEIPQIPCQPQELNQVFMNLLQNAVQAIEGVGGVRVRTFSEPQHVLVEIADSGCGMSPERLDRIFEPFFTTKPVGQGTGLGLSICYEIIKKHGGTIQVESAPGKGSTFRLRLPLTPPDSADVI
ncbi:MAG: ATP-binding protein, partial [Desulfuromonadaceae bacterium]